MIVRYEWTQIAGPSRAEIVDKNTASAKAEKLSNLGRYTFLLKVFDYHGFSGRDTVIIKVIKVPRASHSNDACAGCWDY